MAELRSRIENYISHRDFAMEVCFTAMMKDPQWGFKVREATHSDSLVHLMAAYIEMHPEALVRPYAQDANLATDSAAPANSYIPLH